MLTGNFKKNFTLNSINKFTIRQIVKSKFNNFLTKINFNSISISNREKYLLNNQNKFVISTIDNKNKENIINNIEKKSFTKKFKKNLFENFSINKQDKDRNTYTNKNKSLRLNDYDYDYNFNENENKNKNENEINKINDIENKLDNLMKKMNISLDDNDKDNYNNDTYNFNSSLDKNLSKVNLNLEDNKDLSVSDNDPKKKLEEFKDFIKSTINIPKTDFNERMNIKENEINKLNKITEDYYIDQLGLFQESDIDILINKDKDIKENSITNKKNKLWITHDVPTQILGLPHFNLLNNKVFKDAVNRIKNLQGYRVLYKPGFSCFGRETENFIFKKLNKKKFKNLEELLDNKFQELTNEIKNEYEYENENNKNNPNADNITIAFENERKNLNLSRQKSLYFREQCRKYIEEYILKQKEYIKRLGVMSYYNYSYSTYEKEYEKKQLDFFQELYEKGLIFRDYRKILWSENRQQILEASEVEESSELNESCVIKFPVIELSNDLKEIQKNYPNKKFNFLGFTTQAYKYIGIQALSINDDADYCIAELSQDKNDNDFFICAYKRFPEICKRANKLSSFKVHFVAKGWAFKNLIAKDPLFNRKLPIISNENISVLFGTGINLISPAHDNHNPTENEEEKNIPRKFNLSMKSYLDENNNFCKTLGLYFHNTNAFFNGDSKVIKKLQQSKNLLFIYKYENKFLKCKKTGERISSRTIGSFFLKIDDKIKNQTLKELAFVKFYPELNFEDKRFKKKFDEKKLKYSPRKKMQLEGKSEMKDYFNVIEELESITEWCISEYNNWGIPIPYFVNIETGNFLMNSNVIKHVKNLFNEHGSDIWFSWSIEDLLPDEYKKFASEYTTGKENFDWLFDSAISWFTSANFSEEEIKSLKELEEFRRMNYLRENNSEFNRIKANEEKENFLKRKKLLEKENNETNENNYDLNININIDNDNYSDISLNLANKENEEIKNYFANNENDGIEKDYDNYDITNNNNEENLFENLTYESDKVKDLIPRPLLKEHLVTKIKDLITKEENKEETNFNLNLSKHPLINSLKNSSYASASNFDIVIEGKNQHSLWLLMSSLTSISYSNFNIYKRVITHGYILDSMGKEISENNFRDALDIIDGTIKRNSNRDYGNGADTLRLYFLRHSNDNDYKLYEEDILKSKDDIKKIRKITKICISLLNDYDENKIEAYLINKFQIHMEELDILDQIVYYEFLKFYERAQKKINDFNLPDLISLTLDFINKTLNDYYLDSCKFIIVNYKKNDLRRLIKQFILKEILLNTIKILHPLIPFTTEDIYSHLYFLKEKKKYLGFEEFKEIDSLRNNLNFNLSKFQENNFEYKAKLMIQIKNKFLYFFKILCEKIHLKNNLKESEFRHHEEIKHDYLPEEIEKFDINKLQDVEKHVKMLKKNKISNLKVNLIENENYYNYTNLIDNDNNNSNEKNIMIYKNDLYGSDIVQYDEIGNLIKPKNNQKRFYLPKQNELEIILIVKDTDSYEYKLFDELEKLSLLDAYFGVAKCYLIIQEDVEKSNTEFSSINNKKSEYDKIIEDKEVLTEAEFALKNDYHSPTDGKKIIKTLIKMTILKNQNFKCLRCNFQRCNKQNKICMTCKNILKDEI